MPVVPAWQLQSQQPHRTAGLVPQQRGFHRLPVPAVGHVGHERPGRPDRPHRGVDPARGLADSDRARHVAGVEVVAVQPGEGHPIRKARDGRCRESITSDLLLRLPGQRARRAGVCYCSGVIVGRRERQCSRRQFSVTPATARTICRRVAFMSTITGCPSPGDGLDGSKVGRPQVGVHGTPVRGLPGRTRPTQ